METNAKIKFTRNAKNGEWAKGDFGVVRTVLAKRPDATSDIYLVELEDHQIVWATNEDLEPVFWEQLTLF